MTWMRCIGGHAHDRWYDVDTRSRSLIVPEIRSIVFTEEPAPLGEMPPMTLYTVERLIWPGFRIPIYVLTAPGVKVTGHAQPFDSSWTNPLVPIRCRCEEMEPPFAPWPRGLYQVNHLSACHLDHCPEHGRWTFPPITPLWVSLTARAEWLAEQGWKPTGVRNVDAGALWNRYLGRPE